MAKRKTLNESLPTESGLGEDPSTVGRRRFLASSAALGAVHLLSDQTGCTAAAQDGAVQEVVGQNSGSPLAISKSVIGGYGSWASRLAPEPAKLSFRNERWKNIDEWRAAALEKTSELVAAPDLGGAPQVTVDRKYQYDSLEIEELHWRLPHGRPTRAVLLKPQGASGPLPAVLGLHDHGGNKYFGKRKITRTSDAMHPNMVDHQKEYYEGLAWANEIAKRGYVVLVHDTFTFASRRVLLEEMTEIPWGTSSTRGISDDKAEDPKNIAAYNRWAAGHESVMAKSLFCAGTTWPGVYLAEDQRALDVLANRDDVDADRLGCAGLSGGGLRTVYLGGLDSRIKCAVCVGFMSTWNDFLLNKSYTHTWMTYAPLLPNYLDFPEILGLRVPLPTMTLSCNEDGLYTLGEMKKANDILQQVFAKAGAAERYRGGFYPGGHKFDQQMQHDAFAWFDRWLV